MKFSKKFLITGAVVLTVVVGGGAYAIFHKATPKYETETVQRSEVVEQVSVTGSVAPMKKIVIQPEVSGRIAAIDTAEGADVKAGDKLIELDSADLQAKIAAQRAVVDGAKATLDQYIAGSTVQELAVAQAAVNTAQSKYDASVSAQTDAQSSLDDAKRSFDNVTAKAQALEESKRDALLADYSNATNVASDAVGRLTTALFANDDSSLTFTSSNSQAETDAKSTRKIAKASLATMQSVVLAARTTGTTDAAMSAYAAVSDGLAAVKAHVDATATLLQYATGLTPTTLSSYQLNVSTAQSTIVAAQQSIVADNSALDLQLKLNDSDITAAQIAVTQAQNAVNNAASSLDTAAKSLAEARAQLTLKQSGNRPEVIAAQRAVVNQELGSLDELNAELAKRTIVAPIDAVVTLIPVEVGETAQPSAEVIELQAKGNFEIITNISEIDIAHVALHDPVSITLDALGRDVVLTGTVVKIQPAEKVVEGVIFYETTIDFDKEDPRLRSGMTANLAIETARKENVLRVPIRALREQNGKTYVEKLVNGKVVNSDITVGVQNTTHVEALSGVQEGDVVIIGEVTK